MFTEITNILDNYLEENEFECSTEIGLDFAYYYAESKIVYSLVTTEKTDRLFMEFAKANGLKVDCGIFLFSFFHELGHNETIDFLDDKVEKKCRKIKETLREDNEEDCKKYFSLADEKEATMWAVDYINNNIEKIEKLAKNLQKAIDKL